MAKFRVHVSVCGMIYYDGESIQDVENQIAKAGTINLDDLDHWDIEVLKIENDAKERQWEKDNNHPSPVTDKTGRLNNIRASAVELLREYPHRESTQ